MRRLFLATLALFVSASPTFGQQSTQEIKHAPTVEQCRADGALWDANPFALEHLPITTVKVRQAEMIDCESVDKDSWQRIVYLRVVTTTAMEDAHRAWDFLKRHQLLNQFLDEDKATH